MNRCGYSMVVDSSAEKNTLLEMSHEFDELGLNQQIIETLDDAIRLGLVEVTGITKEGEWLYSATAKCRQLIENSQSFTDVAVALMQMLEEEENNQQ